MSKKSHHFLTLWPWPLTYDLEKLIRSGHYHYQCVYQIWEQSIQWFLSYRVNTIAGGGRRAADGGRLWRKTITSPDPSVRGYKKTLFNLVISLVKFQPTTNTYVAEKKWSQCETVALWNSLVTWKLAQYLSDVTGSPTVKLSTGQRRSVTCGSFVDHQYSWFGRIPSAVANRYRKSASLLKRSVSITLIS